MCFTLPESYVLLVYNTTASSVHWVRRQTALGPVGAGPGTTLGRLRSRTLIVSPEEKSYSVFLLGRVAPKLRGDHPKTLIHYDP